MPPERAFPLYSSASGAIRPVSEWMQADHHKGDHHAESDEHAGYQFNNPALLRRALTHPSMGSEDNQRLEFLGDAVLQYIMSDILYATHPKDREGQLTHLRALLVCEAALSQVARSLHVGEALIMDKGEALTGGRDKPSVLCDAMESILAAAYLDGGLDAARGIIQRHWPRPEDVHRPMQDSKGALQ